MPRNKSYTVEYKLSALRYLDNDANGSVSQTAREFGVDRKRIREWRENRDALLLHETGQEKKKRKLHRGRAIRSDEVDLGVLEFLDQERTEGRVVRNKDLMRKAMQIAGGLELDGFSASAMWLKRWKKRHGVSSRRGTSTNQKVPADFEQQLFDFRRAVLRLRHRHMYPLWDIMNMDQTMVRFDMVPSRTNNRKGMKQVRTKTTKAEKRGFTVALLAAADGTKLPAFVLFKERNGEIPRRARLQLQVPDNIRVTATRNGWMTREALLSWIQRILGPSHSRRLLVLDSYAAHRTAEARAAFDENDVDLVYVPGGCTALAQPVDVGIAKPFKDGVRDCWVEWMTQVRPPTAAGNLRQPTRQDVITWVSQAWDRVSPDTIVKAFLRCAISNALDGSEDDQTLEWFPDDIAAFLPNAAEESSDSDNDEEEDELQNSSEADADEESDFDGFREDN